MTDPPRRGGIHDVQGVYQGGCAFDDEYKLLKPKSFKYTTQLRNAKQRQISEQKLMDLQNDTSAMKFNRKMELDISNTDQLDKEQFVTAVKSKVKFYGL